MELITKKYFSESVPQNANEASATLTFSGVVSDAETVTINDSVYEFDNNDTITEGNIEVNMIPYLPKAEGTLTFTGVVSDTETVTIGDDTYEFDTNDSVEEGNISVDVSDGVTKEEAIVALLLAISENEDSVITAVEGENDDIIVTAKTGGTDGNAIASTETVTNATWGNATLENGADTLTEQGGAAALAEAINYNETMVVAIDNENDTMTLEATKVGTEGNDIEIDEDATNATWGVGVEKLSGGQYGTIARIGGSYFIDDVNNLMYIATKPNDKVSKNWRSVLLTDI